MDLATAITGVLLSHNHSPADVLLLEEIWCSSVKVDVKIIPSDYNVSWGHFLPLFISTCFDLNPKYLAPDPVSGDSRWLDAFKLPPTGAATKDASIPPSL